MGSTIALVLQFSLTTPSTTSTPSTAPTTTPRRSTNGTFGAIITKRYGKGSLTQLYGDPFYGQNEADIRDKLKYILDTLYRANIDHGDLQSDNFLYDIIDGEIEFKIIDFDSSCELNRERVYDICVRTDETRKKEETIHLIYPLLIH